MFIAAATNASTTGGTSSGGSTFFIFIAIALGLVWLIVIRPQRRKQKLQKGMQSELAVGDEIVTAGGVYGTVTRIDDEEDEIGVEIAPGVEIRLARRAIAAQLTESEPEPDPDPEADDPDAPDSGDDNPG
jgi:preprotein translocase subunit YajC